MRCLADFNKRPPVVTMSGWRPSPSPPGSQFLIDTRTRGRGPHLVTTGDLYLPTSGDFKGHVRGECRCAAPRTTASPPQRHRALRG
jgi:hypothetical protein